MTVLFTIFITLRHELAKREETQAGSKMATELVCLRVHHQFHMPRETSLLLFSARSSNIRLSMSHPTRPRMRKPTHQPVMIPVPPRRANSRRKSSILATAEAGGAGGGGSVPPLDLTEDNVRQVLADARVEFEQIFDDSVGITGQAELAELDGPFVKISLKGRFWHKRSTVLARLGNYLKQRIPEILEVDIEDEKQLDDRPENF